MIFPAVSEHRVAHAGLRLQGYLERIYDAAHGIHPRDDETERPPLLLEEDPDSAVEVLYRYAWGRE